MGQREAKPEGGVPDEASYMTLSSRPEKDIYSFPLGGHLPSYSSLITLQPMDEYDPFLKAIGYRSD